MNAHSPVQIGNDPWDFWWRLGYRWLTPIMPPECQLSPTSSIFKKIAKGGKDDRGKAPGIRLNNGLWVGHDFTTCRPTLRQTEAWRDMGASIGIVLGEGLVAIDADCLEAEHADLCSAEIESRIGSLPCRVGKAPKRLYLCRTAPDYEYRCVLFGRRNEKGLQESRVEVLSTNRQFVAWGLHPGTMRPYEWVSGPLPLEALPYVEPTVLDGLMDALQALLPHAEPVEIGLARREVDQNSLKAEKLEHALAAADALPNTTALFPRRNDYIRVGAAFKAMFADWPDEGFEAWVRWGDKYPPGTNDRETMESDWRRIKAPFDIGAPWVYEKAKRHSGGAFTVADVFNEEVPDAPPAAEKTDRLAPWSQPATVFCGKDVPAQRWLAGEMVPARTVTLLYGDGGTGKSLITLQLAFGVAATGKWLGMDVTRGAALFVTAEDEPEEVHRRIVAVSQGSGLTLEDLGDLHWRSLAGQEAVLAIPDAKTGLMVGTKVFAALRAEIMRLRPTLLVLDTLADLFGGDEIKRIQARQFIQLLQGLIVALPWDMSIVLLAHPSVAGMNSGTGTSGSTAWSNSVRSRLYLERHFAKPRNKDDKEKVEIDPDLRVLSTKKANRTKQGGEVRVRWSGGRFIEQATVAATSDADADATEELVFLEVFEKLTRSGQNLNTSINAPNYAPKLFLSDPAGFQVGRKGLEGAMARLLLQGVLAVENTGSPSRPRFRLIKRQSDLFG